jgi:XTP/dITP diphosphohydrolase
LRLPEPDETGTSFRANAELKALAAAEGAGLPALADDSGLVIPALDGAPGIYSARWAGPMKDFSVAIGRVSAELERLRATDFSAHFVCALSLAWPGGPLLTVEGTVQGTLVLPPRGKRGFGYDLTFGEMEPEIKHRISHRADAFAQLVAQVFG